MLSSNPCARHIRLSISHTVVTHARPSSNSGPVVRPVVHAEIKGGAGSCHDNCWWVHRTEECIWMGTSEVSTWGTVRFLASHSRFGYWTLREENCSRAHGYKGRIAAVPSVSCFQDFDSRRPCFFLFFGGAQACYYINDLPHIYYSLTEQWLHTYQHDCRGSAVVMN